MSLGGPSLESGQVLAVSELTRAIKLLLEPRFRGVWTRGEVSNFRRQASGHLYFTLKDERSQIPAVMFRGAAAALGFAPENGMEVVAYGELSVYEPHGRYQLVVRAMNESGAGRLHREFERLKTKLQAEGLFDAARKRPLPRLPRRVGVLTSPSGAAIQDALRIFRRRRWTGTASIIPVRVQGKEAGPEIAEALAWADARRPGFDLLVLMRGGGSLEDLWPFNEEAVARAVAACATPTLSAVGHEIDFTLCDFAADVRAETPSAAAELITSAFVDCLERLDAAAAALERTQEERRRRVAERLGWIGERFGRAGPAAALERRLLELDDVAGRLDRAGAEGCRAAERRLGLLASRLRDAEPGREFARLSARLAALRQRWAAAPEDYRLAWRGRLATLTADLRGLDPKEALRRGYAFLQRRDGSPIGRRAELPEREPFSVELRDGRAWARRSDPPEESH